MTQFHPSHALAEEVSQHISQWVVAAKGDRVERLEAFMQEADQPTAGTAA